MRTEFEFLAHLKNHFNLSRIGDDCAVFPKDENHDYLITSDMLVENIDFRLDWAEPKFIGHKALAVSVSDIAAMGGVPRYSLLSIGIPEAHWETNFLDELYSGYMRLAGRLGVELIGGDLSHCESGITIDSTVIGTSPKGQAVMRKGATPGDLVFVSGTLGGAACGLKLLESGERLGPNLETWKTPLVNQQLRPTPVDGSFLTRLASSAIDISDGFAADLYHLCEASDVGARIIRAQIPVDSNISGLGLSAEEVYKMVLHGGEDFQILFTISPEKFSALRSFPFAPVGEITEHIGNIELIIDGLPSILEPKGYSHF